jgi:hypothetical protein
MPKKKWTTYYKWTDYYGAIRKVTFHVDEEGNYNGFLCEDIGAGICGMDESKWPPPANHYWDTEEEARKGIVENLKELLSKDNAVVEWMKNAIKDLKDNHIYPLVQRIKEFEKRAK